MLKALTVENYRGFRDKTFFELRPLTVLLGRNSSGKSSLTRLIPLFQQSLSRNSASPILWSSDIVDMGNISDVISHSETPLELRFGFQVSAEHLDLFLRRYQYGPAAIPEFTHDDIVEYSIRLSADGPRTRFNGLQVDISGQSLRLDWDYSGKVTSISVDKMEYLLENGSFTVDTSSLFPEITRTRLEDDGPRRRRRQGLMLPELKAELDRVTHGRTAADKIAYTADTAPFIPKRSARRGVRQLNNVVDRKVTENLASKISDLSFIHNAARIINFLQSEIEAPIASAAYIGPSRVSGNRFDRIQELAVNRLDPSGTNTAMYIYSLSEEERNSFNDLLIRACGHMLSVEESGAGHVSIKIGRVGQNHFENITDVGFGYSQLVPVIAQLHAVREREIGTIDIDGKDVIFAVEQPELHLHPSMQASLADLFVSAVKTATRFAESTTVIVETHSETFVSQLGLLIAENAIVPTDVAIYFVDKDDGSDESRLTRAHFSKDGLIETWPIGFFSAS